MKRERTPEEQGFIDWYELTFDFGFFEILTESDIQKYEFLINHTK